MVIIIHYSCFRHDRLGAVQQNTHYRLSHENEEQRYTCPIDRIQIKVLLLHVFCIYRQHRLTSLSIMHSRDATLLQAIATLDI